VRKQRRVAALTAGACAIALGVSPAASGAAAQPFTVSGPVRVIDADTLVVNGISVRLKGVDAMERGTPEGDGATATMRALVREGETVTCSVTGEKTHRREVGHCVRDDDGLDLNRAIVAAGVALGCPRYDPRYVEAETADAPAVAAGTLLRSRRDWRAAGSGCVEGRRPSRREYR
jgi:micrococcal nuclease